MTASFLPFGQQIDFSRATGSEAVVTAINARDQPTSLRPPGELPDGSILRDALIRQSRGPLPDVQPASARIPVVPLHRQAGRDERLAHLRVGE